MGKEYSYRWYPPMTWTADISLLAKDKAGIIVLAIDVPAIKYSLNTAWITFTHSLIRLFVILYQ